MALDWCMNCRRPMQAGAQGDYCSHSCFRASQASSSTTTLDTYFTREAAPAAYDDDTASEVVTYDVPSPTQWPQAGIDAWRHRIPAASPTMHPYTVDRARPHSPNGSITSSTQTFSRPELLRRHTPNSAAPPSVAVCKYRHAVAAASPPAPMPHRPQRPSWAQPGTSSATASYITESLIATPVTPVRPNSFGGFLHRVKSWVRADGASTPTSGASAAAPAFVALPGMDSTATLVGDVAAAAEKKAAALDADLLDDDEESPRGWHSRSPPGLRRAEFRAPRASRLALDAHPAYDSRGRARVAIQPSRPPLFSPYGHAL